MSEFQQNMNFEKRENQFKDALFSGKFIFLAECSPPDNEQHLSSAVERMMPLAETMYKQQDIFGGLAVTDLCGSPWSAVEVAAAMPDNIRNRNCFFLSGCGRNRDSISEQLNIAGNAGVMNLICVSGDSAGMTLRECRSKDFCDSISQLELIARRDEKFFSGTQFNPFHYDKNTIFASYSALNNKINAGSQFFITQSGWDMLQNQTFSWYMLNRQCYVPMIAHLTILTPDKVEKIIAGQVPGVRISPAFRKLLEQELSGSKAQFEAAQYRRLELQCAGCRLLGYSGVQISGVDYPGRAQIIASRIRSALQEFRTFEHWLDEYNSHQAGAEMGTGISKYHLYDRVLRRPYSFDEPPRISDPGKPDFSWKEKLSYKLKRMFFSKADKHRPDRDLLTKKLLVNCRRCDKCDLPETYYICTRNCPKRLINGPCGAVGEDGKCAFSASECIFVKKVRCSRWRESISCLESDH